MPDSQGWLHLSWDPMGARFCMGKPPTRGDVAEAFSVGERLHKVLRGLILVDVEVPVEYERVVQFKFAKRQGGELECSLWCEIMGKYVSARTRHDQIVICRLSYLVLVSHYGCGGYEFMDRILRVL